LEGFAFPKDGFDAYRRNKAEDIEEPGQSAETKSGDRLISNHEINFAAILLSRCSFFLSNSNLKLQVESCAAMTQGFQFLSLAAQLCKVSDSYAGNTERFIRMHRPGIWGI
jgi:hypothetical protein